MHACGHDMHVDWLVGATTLFAQARDAWQGTLMAVFQPAEETAEGAQAMIDDGLFKRFPKPDVVLGQHVMVGPAGAIGGRAGVDHLRGRQPADPPVRTRRARLDAAGQHRSGGDGGGDGDAAADHRLPRTRGRPRPPWSPSASLQAGTKENVIPDEAIIKLNVRTFDEGVRKRVLAAIERIVNAEAAASGAPEAAGDHAAGPLSAGASTTRRRRKRVADAFRQHFPRRPRAGDRTGVGERGLRIVRRRVARPVGVLVRRRHRPRPLREGQGGGPAQRDPDQPQPALSRR